MTTPHLTDVGSGSPDWETPDALFQLLDARWKFDYDPFAAPGNHKTPLFSSLSGTFHRTGPGPFGLQKISDLDGLEQPWAGRRVFANPPYSRGVIDRCIARAIAEAPTTQCCVLLVPSATSTQWFHSLSGLGYASYLPKRVDFVHPPYRCKPECEHALGQPIKNPPSGMMVFEFFLTQQQWMTALA